MSFWAQVRASSRVRLKRAACTATLASAFFGVLALPAPAIIGGTATTTDEWPWQGHLTIQNWYQCGATLLEPRVVLTAAHCVDSAEANELFLRFGRTDLTVAERGEVAATVADLFVSPQWDIYQGFQYDYALLLLEQRVNTIKPIDLARASDAPYHEGDPAWVTGWGITDSRRDIAPNVLQEGQVQLGNCYWDSALYFCTYGIPTTCFGDSGGPLMIGVEGNRRFRQIGVTSFGDSMCDGHISGFTNVARGPVRAELDAALAELKEKAPPPHAGGPPPGPPPPIGAGPPPPYGPAGPPPAYGPTGP